MNPAAYIGVDPGAGGALALFSPLAYEMALPQALQTLDVPTHEINGKRRVDMHALLGLLVSWAQAWDVKGALVENVGAMPGQSPNGMFHFGFACGTIQMAVVAAGLPLRLVTPQVWKKRYGLTGGRENKDMSRQKASQLFPSHIHLWTRKKDDGRAEASLLAHYGAQQ